MPGMLQGPSMSRLMESISTDASASLKVNAIACWSSLTISWSWGAVRMTEGGVLSLKMLISILPLPCVKGFPAWSVAVIKN